MNRKNISQPFIWTILILLLAGCGSPTSTPALVLPTATFTPIPSTSTPTLTPTTTPTDTATPISSPTATSTVAASSPYLDEVNVNLQAFQNAFNNASNYVQTPTTDLSVLLNENWKQEAGAALGELNEAASQLESIDNPPPEYAQLDMYLKSIASETHEMVNNYGNGVDQLDPGALSSAVNNLGNISSYVNNATTELNKYYSP